MRSSTNSSTSSSSTSKTSHHTLLSIDQTHHHRHHEFHHDRTISDDRTVSDDRTGFKSHPVQKPIRDWIRRARRKSPLRLPVLITSLATTLAFTIWWIRKPSIVWNQKSSSSFDLLSRTSTTRLRPLFTLLIAPHPGRPTQINLNTILHSIRQQSAHLQLHSITLICTPPSSCPFTIPSQVQKLNNLNSFYPHPDSKAVLIIESEDGLSELNPNWTSNALDLLFIDPQKPRLNQIISASGLIRSHHRHLPTRLDCKVGDAQTITRVELPLAPILIKSQPWSRLTDYSEEDWLARSGLPSLRLSLDLFDRQLPSFVMPTIDSSAVWKSCEKGLGEVRASAIGPGLEAQLVQHLDDTLHFEDQQRESDQSGQGRLCVLLEELNQLEEGLGWDSIICNFLERGVSLDVLVMVDRLDERAEVKQRMKFLKCVVDIEIMTRTTSKTRIESESRWHQFFVSRGYSVLLFPKNSMDPVAKHVLEHRLGTDFGQYEEDQDHQAERLVAIGLPSKSVKGADWITGLELHALRNWYKPKIDISVITNDRPNSLSRLMDSLRNADYYGDEVNLILNLEQTSDLRTRKLCANYKWDQGPKIIRQRIIHAGLLPAVIESWYPSSPHDSYGVLLEDDVEVSTKFYAWVKFALLTYRYSSKQNESNHSSLYGISLYQPQHIELKPEGRRPFNATELLSNLGFDPITSPYLSQIPCSWGALFFPESWIGFQHYLSLRLSDSLKPKLKLEGSAILTPIRSTRWPKSWKKYLIEWVYLRGEVMLYPNFRSLEGESESLSTNHLEQGTHIHDQVEEEVKKTFEVKLMKSDRSLLNSIGIQSHRLPKLINLMCVDLWGEISNLDELLERGWVGANTLGFCDDEDEDGDEVMGLNKLVCRM